MIHGTVVVVGSLPVQHVGLDVLVTEFGWSLKVADSLRSLAELNACHSLVIVIFSPRNLGLPWNQALRGVQDAAPQALPILCHGFADPIEWPRAAEAGAFHALLLPFDMREVRQSLGFARDAIAARQPAAAKEKEESSVTTSANAAP